MPQDRVAEFSSLDPNRLLLETERAIGDADLYNEHQKLIGLSKETLSARKVIQSLTKARVLSKFRSNHVKVRNCEVSQRFPIGWEAWSSFYCWSCLVSSSRVFGFWGRNRDFCRITRREMELVSESVVMWALGKGQCSSGTGKSKFWTARYGIWCCKSSKKR